MSGKTVIIGAGSVLGQMLHARWGDDDTLRWVSRAGPLAWAVEQGADALAPHLDGADSVLCLAGITSGPVDFDLNTSIAKAVVAASPDTAHIFLASTQAVYGPYPGPHSEDGATRAKGAYGESKLAMEQAVLGQGRKITALRLANVLGADMLGRNVAEGKPMQIGVFPDGRAPRRTYIDPDGLALGLSRLFDLAHSGAPLPERLNMGRAPMIEMADILRAIDVPFETPPANVGALPEVSMDLTRLFDLVPELSAPLNLQDWAAL